MQADPVQYSIFDSIYRIEENHLDSGLFLIGDPKQAIYAFRGADIYTYLRARQSTTGRHHTLGTNFRSSHAMVEAVNHVFQPQQNVHGDSLRLPAHLEAWSKAPIHARVSGERGR